MAQVNQTEHHGSSNNNNHNSNIMRTKPNQHNHNNNGINSGVNTIPVLVQAIMGIMDIENRKIKQNKV